MTTWLSLTTTTGGGDNGSSSPINTTTKNRSRMYHQNDHGPIPLSSPGRGGKVKMVVPRERTTTKQGRRGNPLEENNADMIFAPISKKVRRMIPQPSVAGQVDPEMSLWNSSSLTIQPEGGESGQNTSDPSSLATPPAAGVQGPLPPAQYDHSNSSLNSSFSASNNNNNSRTSSFILSSLAALEGQDPAMMMQADASLSLSPSSLPTGFFYSSSWGASQPQQQLPIGFCKHATPQTSPSSSSSLMDFNYFLLRHLQCEQQQLHQQEEQQRQQHHEQLQWTSSADGLGGGGGGAQHDTSSFGGSGGGDFLLGGQDAEMLPSSFSLQEQQEQEHASQHHPEQHEKTTTMIIADEGSHQDETLLVNTSRRTPTLPEHILVDQELAAPTTFTTSSNTSSSCHEKVSLLHNHPLFKRIDLLAQSLENSESLDLFLQIFLHPTK
ncbi:hypothetical protein ACA910_014372 [Epithemia clementina (nom. ined.)]